MSSKNVPTATDFRDRFLESYDKCRSAFKTTEAWKEVWPRWNELMLSQIINSPSLRRIQKSVLAKTAQELGLHYWKGQPLTVDAVFSHEENWFPILVAIEHENNWRGFESEVTKLLSLRCPLKVGITYTGDSPKGQEYREQIAEIIREDFDEISSTAGEDRGTEYLFLVGAESDKQEISRWYSLSFRASDGPGNKVFQAGGPF